MSGNRSWYINGLREWRRKWVPTKADHYRLSVLRGTGHPVADYQARGIAFKEKIVALIDDEIEAASRERES